MEVKRRAKIIATIGPACDQKEQIEKLIDAGMNVARLNFSHGSHESHQKVIDTIHEIRQRRECSVAIMVDLKGPEVRTGDLETDLDLKEGDRLLLNSTFAHTKEYTEIPVLGLEALGRVAKGATVLFDDGAITSIVIEVGKRGLLVEILSPGILKSKKGMNFPGSDLELPLVTEKDIEDIRFAARNQVEWLAASFVHSADQIRQIKSLLHREGRHEIGVIAKIESSQGVDAIDAIIAQSDAIMVARGDLGVEIDIAKVPSIQKRLIKKCLRAAKPSIVATQMLETMTTNSKPTRAEVSDVFNAISDGTSCVMLSGETAVGKAPQLVIRTMSEIIIEAEKDFDTIRHFEIHANDRIDVSHSVAVAAVKTAMSSDAKAIFTFSYTGQTAIRLARFKPRCALICVTPNLWAFYKLGLIWGTSGIIEKGKDITEGFKQASCVALLAGLVDYGDLVCLTAGYPYGIAGTTNMLMIENIGTVLVRGKGCCHCEGVVSGKVSIILEQKDIEEAEIDGRIVVLKECLEEMLKYLNGALAIILQNRYDDIDSVQRMKTAADTLDIPYIHDASGACEVLSDGQFTRIDACRGVVFSDLALSKEEMIEMARKRS